MKKLFKILPDNAVKTKILHIRILVSDSEIITGLAKARNISVCEYMRRTALGRRTDICYESQVVLALTEVVEAFKMLHLAVVEHGLLPTEHEWDPVLDEAVAAMQRISK